MSAEGIALGAKKAALGGKPKNAKYFVNSAIVLFFFFGFGLLPAFGGLSYAGMRSVGIFIGLLWGWITVDFAWVSIIGILAMGTTGAMTVTEAVEQSLLTTTFWQMLVPMVLLAYLTQSGFAEWVGYKIVAWKVLRGRPWATTAFILLAATVMCFFVTTWPMIFVMWALFEGLATAVGYQKGDKYVAYVMCGIVFMQTIVASAFPWHFYAITLNGLMASVLNGYAYPFVQLCVLGTVGSLLAWAVYVAIGRFIVRPDVSRMCELPESFYEKAAAVKLTREGKVGCGIMVALVTLMLLSSVLPSESALGSLLSDMGLQGIGLFLLAVLLLLRDKDGNRLTTINKLAGIGLSWEILFLVVSTLALAALLRTEAAGVFQLVNSHLIPFVTSMNPAVFLIATLAIFWVVTQFTHNFVIVLTLVGALAGVCPTMGVHPWVFGFMFMCCMNFAYSTPAASSPGALCYANEWIGKKSAYVYGILFSVIGFVVYVAVMLPLSTALFGSFA